MNKNRKQVCMGGNWTPGDWCSLFSPAFPGIIGGDQCIQLACHVCRQTHLGQQFSYWYLL